MERITRDEVTVSMVPPEVTSDYRDGGAGASPPPRRPKVSLLADAGSGGDYEVRELLRLRLRAIALVVAAANAINLVQYVLTFAASTETSYLAYVLRSPLRTLSHVYVVAYILSAVLVSNRPPRSLPVLRVYEGLIFAGGILFVAIWNWRLLTVSGWLPEVFRYGELLPYAVSMNWFFIIVGYGTLIPNTGRRCALAVGLMAALPLALNVFALAVNPVPGSEFVDYVLSLILWMMYAVVIAIVGSHRLEKLRREASAARQLGQYRLKERLGAGGMGEVFLAEHVLLRRPCAIKLIRPDRAGDPQSLLRFEREVQTTATLSHPNTVQIYDYGHTEDGTFYYAMEYLPGLTLEQLVERHGALSPARAVHFLRQLCGSLGEAHGVGLIHRDLKPGNVMVCARGGVYDVAKLLDFGLVLPQAENAGEEKLTHDGTITGTPAYMSPEQAGGQVTLDPRSDIYSVGAVAYFLLTGRPPFAGRSVVKTLAAHLYEKPDPVRQNRPDVPTDLEHVVAQCLAKEPDERFVRVDELEAALVGCECSRQWSPLDAATWWRSQPGVIVATAPTRGSAEPLSWPPNLNQNENP